MRASAIARAWEDNRLPMVIGLSGVILGVSLFYTPYLLVLLVGIPACFYFISRPYELLLFMVFLIPFNFVIRIGPLPVAAELLKLAAWIPFLVQFSARNQRFKTSRYNWCFAVLFGLFVLSILRANDLPYTVTQTLRFALNIGLCYLVLNLVDNREKVFQIFRVLAFSTFLVACYGFYQFAIQDYGALFWIVNPRMETSLAHGRSAFWPWRNRMISVLTSEMELGHYFNLCLPIGIVLWLTEGRKRIGSRWALVTVTMLAGLLLSFTFGAWLALVATAAFVVLLFAKEQRWKTVLTGALVLIFAGTVLAFGPLQPFLEQKIGGMEIGGLAWDIVSRLEAWTFALGRWWSHPLLGLGVGNYEILEAAHEWLETSAWAPAGGSPHETYIYILVQYGLAGLASILVILVGTIRTNLSLKRNPEWGLIAVALAFALATNMLGGFSDDSAFFGPHASYLVWLFIGLSEAIRNLSDTSKGKIITR